MNTTANRHVRGRFAGLAAGSILWGGSITSQLRLIFRAVLFEQHFPISGRMVNVLTMGPGIPAAAYSVSGTLVG